MYLLLLPEWWGHSIWHEADMEKINLYKNSIMMTNAAVTVCMSRSCSFHLTCGCDWAWHSIILMKWLYIDMVRAYFRDKIFTKIWWKNHTNDSPRTQSNTHTHTHSPLVPYSCRCRWCTSRRVGSTPPAAAAAGWGSGGSGWTLWPGASGGDTWLCPSTTAGWWQTRSQRCWRTLELGEKV